MRSQAQIIASEANWELAQYKTSMGQLEKLAAKYGLDPFGLNFFRGYTINHAENAIKNRRDQRLLELKKSKQ